MLQTGPETWTLTRTERSRLEAFYMWLWRRMEKISWLNEVTNEGSSQESKRRQANTEQFGKGNIDGLAMF